MASLEPSAVTLVTGAAGKTGRAAIRALLAAGRPVRAFVRSTQQSQEVERLGVDRVIVGDLRDGHAVTAAARGVASIYHICPNLHPDELAIGRSAINAGRAAGIERFVFHSVLHPQVEAMPHHWAKLRVEELLFESGLPFTILQPAPYMQNILGQWQRIVEERVYAVPYAPTTRLAMVDLEDVAAVLPRILNEPRHAGATYELCGAELLDQTEIASILGRVLGGAVRAERLPLAAWSQAADCAPGSYRDETLARMFAYYERYGMTGGSASLEWLLGRPPTPFASLAERLA